MKAVCVAPGWVGRGFARRIVTEIEADITANGHRQADLMATLNSIAFYRRLGYVGSAPANLKSASRRIHSRTQYEQSVGEIRNDNNRKV